jgi:hypothetical protein
MGAVLMLVARRAPSDEVSIQLDDHVEDELRFRVEATLRGGTINPNIVVKATALKQLLDELAELRRG